MVLEHLERPWDAVKEMYRVVKPGGHVLLTTPLFWHLHEEPRDFYRYTKYGLQYLFETEGFETVLIQPMSGFVVTFTQEFIYILNMFKKSKKTRIFKPIIHVLQFLLQSIAYSINKWDMSHRFTWAYFVVARKKSQAL
jgi:ubiquinone/menaquinone biosynthesis C-methylase UbiE